MDEQTSKQSQPQLISLAGVSNKGECCGNCSAFSPNKQLNPKSGEPRQGWCRAKPPHLVQVMMQVESHVLKPGVGPQVVPGYQGMFAPTADDAWCREWEPKDNGKSAA